MSEQQPGRTRWRVTGAKSDTGEDVLLYVEARSREAAERAVAKTGVMVSSVEREPLAYAGPVPGDEVRVVRVDEIRPGAAFWFGFYSFFGALTGYVLVMAVVLLFLLMLGYLRV